MKICSHAKVVVVDVRVVDVTIHVDAIEQLRVALVGVESTDLRDMPRHR